MLADSIRGCVCVCGGGGGGGEGGHSFPQNTLNESLVALYNNDGV